MMFVVTLWTANLYIVRIVNYASKDKHALISTRRRRHCETQRAPPITNERTADKPWTNEWEIIPVETSIARLVKIIIHLNTSVVCYLWITTIDRRNRLTSFRFWMYPRWHDPVSTRIPIGWQRKMYSLQITEVWSFRT